MSSNNTTTTAETFIWPIINPIGIQEAPLKIAQTAVGTVLNTLALIVLIYMGNKRTYSHCLFISLTISDLVISSVYSALSIYAYGYYKWPFGDAACLFNSILSITQYVVSNSTLVMMSLHRSLLLSRPLTYNETLNWLKCILLVSCWLLPYALITGLVLWYNSIGRIIYYSCSIVYHLEFVWAYISAFIFLPGIVSVVTNLISIVSLVMKLRRKKRLACLSGPTTMTNANNSSTVVPKPSAGRKLMSNEMKAVICILLIVCNVSFTQYPFMSIWPTITACPDCISLTNIFITLRVVFFFPIVNPIILFVFNGSFQQHAIKLIKKILFIK